MHILHLEDDGPLREILKVALQSADPKLELHQFASSDEALDYIEANKDQIDLFILDIRVPGKLDGVGIAQKIRELKCRGAIVVTSAYRAPNRDLLSSLNIEWMPKPWHILDAAKKLLPLAKQNRAM
jgi:DNA-binding response OmpR family regulator